MNLPGSIVVTAMIAAVVWFGAAFQPVIGEEESAPDVDTRVDAPPNTGVNPNLPGTENPAVNQNSAVDRGGAEEEALRIFDALKLVGVSQEIPLERTADLWLRFNDRSDLHNRLFRMKATANVYYRDFSSDFSRAKVTIGYDGSELSGIDNEWIDVNPKRFETLLPAGEHSKRALDNIWRSIDYTRVPNAVLERHTFSASGEMVSTVVYVRYQ